jgi:hypothetical protein
LAHTVIAQDGGVFNLNAFTVVQCIKAGFEGLTSSLTKSNANVIHSSAGMLYATVGTALAQRSYFLTPCRFTYLSDEVLNVIRNTIRIII